MENVTVNSSVCVCGSENGVYLSLLDIITFVAGQPVVVMVLWNILTSGKPPDILSCNLAIFYNVQYVMSLVHLCVLSLLPDKQSEVYNFLIIYSLTGGSMSLAFICIQRYVAVIHPTSYPLLKKHRYREVCVAMVWLFSLSLALANLLRSNDSYSDTRQIFSSVSVFLFFVMLSMSLRSSIKTTKMLKKPGPERDQLHPAKKKAIAAIRTTSAINMCFYLPVTMMQRFSDVCGKECLVGPLSLLLLSAASVVNPLCYLLSQRAK